MKKRHQQKLVILALGVAMAVNLPLVWIFNHLTVIAGIPLLYFYLFAVWLGSVCISYYVIRRHA